VTLETPSVSETTPIQEPIQVSQPIYVPEPIINPVESIINNQTPVSETPAQVPSSEAISTSSELSFNSETKPTSSTTNNPLIQKIAIIGGVAVGIILVAAGGIIYVANRSETNEINQTNISIEEPMQQIVAPTPTPVPMVEMPINQVLSASEYKLKVEEYYSKYLDIQAKNQLNLTSNVLSTETVKFISDEVFAIATEVNELSLPEELQPTNNVLHQNLQDVVSIYDELLKTYKDSNVLTPEMRNNFTTELNSTEDRLKLTTDSIKNLQ
jgi:hypothetical protein